LNEDDGPETIELGPDDAVPNSRLPVLLYRSVFTPDKDGRARGITEMFTANGWGGTWRDGIYPFHHYHSTSHEVLGIESGTVTVQLGGDSGVSVIITSGDVVVLPAGTGHKRLSSGSELLVIGAYPRGQESPDLQRERSPEAEARIMRVAMPLSDPVRGANGPLMELWQEPQRAAQGAR
jgi:uncharacterized protein YjlB